MTPKVEEGEEVVLEPEAPRMKQAEEVAEAEAAPVLVHPKKAWY